MAKPEPWEQVQSLAEVPEGRRCGVCLKPACKRMWVCISPKAPDGWQLSVYACQDHMETKLRDFNSQTYYENPKDKGTPSGVPIRKEVWDRVESLSAPNKGRIPG